MNLILAALAPALAIALFLYWRDEHEKEPIRLLWRAFYLGALGTIPTLILGLTLQSIGFDSNSDDLAFSFISIMIGVALVEELSKFCGVRWFIYKKHDFNEPYDGIIYSVMAALGFATVENLLYVFDGGMEVAARRAIFAVPGHAIDGVFIGYFLGIQKHYNKKGYEFIGLAAAVLFHTIYDFLVFNSEKQNSFIFFFLVSFFIAFRLALRAIKDHRMNSPFRNKQGS
jgi:RsiW-degrading membrane proteinase PrsW (M82 family)